MNDGWNNFKLVATGRWAVSFIGFLITVPFGLIVSVEREINFNPAGGLYQAFLIACSGYFATFLYVFTLQATILKKRSLKAEPILKCIFTWYSAGVLLGLSTTAYATVAFGVSGNILERVAMPTFYTGVALALTAYFLGTIGRLREENKAFDNLESLLLKDTKELNLSEEENYQNATAVYATLVRPEIKKISNVLSELEVKRNHAYLRGHVEKLQKQSQELRYILDKRISSQPSKIPHATDSWKIKNNDVSLLSEIFPRIISVRLSFLVIVFGAMTGQYPRNGLLGVAAGATGAVFITFGLFILSRFYKRKLIQDHSLLRLLFFLLAFLIQVAWTYLQPFVGFDLNNPYDPLYSGAKTIYGVYIASIIASLIVMNGQQKGIQFERNRTLLREFDRRTSVMEVIEGQILEVRYGSLLGKLGSVSLALNLLDTSDEESQPSLDIEAVLVEASELLSESILILEATSDVSAS